MDIELYKKTMKSRKMTYEDLATETGVSLGAIKRIMAGIAKYPRVDTIEAIESVLGVNKTKTFRTTPRRVPYGFKTVKRSKLETLILQLTIEEKAELTKYAEYLISKREKWAYYIIRTMSNP